MNNKDVIQRISYFRTKLNYSARELSQLIDKSENYINQLESKYFNIPVNILLKIIEIFQIKPEEFFAENYQSYQQDKELLEVIKNLPNEKKQSLIKFI